MCGKANTEGGEGSEKCAVNICRKDNAKGKEKFMSTLTERKNIRVHIWRERERARVCELQ